MKPRTIILSLALIAAIPFVVGEERLGDLNRDSIVLTPGDDINAPSVTTKDGFPVFEIVVPEGYVEVQVRASLTNFEPGFLLKAGATFLYNYIPTGATVAGRKVYRALGTTHEAKWSVANNRWEIHYSDAVLLVSDNQALAPWDIPSGEITAILLPGAEVTPQPPPPGYFAFQKEYFVYRFCTTGAPADAEWGQGSGDPDAWVFIANQSATPGDNTEFKRQKWDQNSSLTSQLQPGGTPGYTVLFQPSRANLGAIEWMQQNHDKLVWIYQVESPAGKPKHPNGSDVWNALHPKEWRKNRITLTP
jgi:hypothetical protein